MVFQADQVNTKAFDSINAHILSMSWAAEPRERSQAKVKSLKLPFKRFPGQVIHCPANLVLIPTFLEKLLDDYKKVEIGVLPTILPKKFESDPAWRPEKNYIIANAFYDDFYLPALSDHEKKHALEIRKQLKKPHRLAGKFLKQKRAN